MKTKITTVIQFGVSIVLLLAMVQQATAAGKISVDEIINRANLAAYYSGDDGRAEARMRIEDSQGRKQLRQFVILRKNHQSGGKQDLMVFFSRPSDVRGTVFRVDRQPGREDDRWLYLPGLDLVKRISAGDKRTSFVGTDFFYEDVSGRDPEADNHTLIDTTDKTYVVNSKPLDADNVEFSYYTSWIDRNTFLPMKVEYTNRRGKVYRRMEVLKVETIQQHPTVTHARISDLERHSSTEMQMRGIQYDIGLPDSIFSERSLRNPPKQWLGSKRK